MTIPAIAPLAADVEAGLVLDAQTHRSPAAVAMLVRAHVRYLQAEARKYAAAEPLVEADDLVSAGIEGFLAAIATFDPTRGARLLTHARPTVALYMAEEVASTGRAIAVPGRTLRKYRRAIRETATVAEARELAATRDGLGRETFDAVHYALTSGGSLEAPVDSPAVGQGAGVNGSEGWDWGGGGRTAEDYSADAHALGARGPAPEGTAISRAMAAQALAALNPREREVVALAYLSGEDLSDAAIAARLGVSRPTVTRTRNAALAAMRDALEA